MVCRLKGAGCAAWKVCWVCWLQVHGLFEEAAPADHLVAVVLLSEQPEGGLDHPAAQPGGG